MDVGGALHSGSFVRCEATEKKGRPSVGGLVGVFCCFSPQLISLINDGSHTNFVLYNLLAFADKF